MLSLAHPLHLLISHACHGIPAWVDGWVGRGCKCVSIKSSPTSANFASPILLGWLWCKGSNCVTMRIREGLYVRNLAYVLADVTQICRIATAPIPHCPTSFAPPPCIRTPLPCVCAGAIGAAPMCSLRPVRRYQRPASHTQPD